MSGDKAESQHLKLAQRNNMRSVTMRKEELRGLVQANRNNHRRAFEKAIVEYRKAVITELDRMIERVKSGDVIEHFIRLPQPDDHTKDYDQVLDMLDYSVDKNIELTHSEFAQYVQDDWGWKDAFTTTSQTLQTYNRT
jgi:hypothetical protein